MTPIVVIPIPLDAQDVWDLFRPYIQRFADTWRKFPPGCDCELIAVVNNSDATNELHEIFDGLPVHFVRYDGAGADAASWQHAAKLYPGRFMLCSTSRAYFHRAGWMARLMEARNEFGPGLYATSASMEGGRFHLCMRVVGIDADIFNLYPYPITSRDQGTFFEIGRDNPDGPFSDWAIKHGVAMVVYWDLTIAGEMAIGIPNTYRDGNQEQILVWDRHTKIFSDASEEEKQRLRAIAFMPAATTCPAPKGAGEEPATESPASESPT